MRRRRDARVAIQSHAALSGDRLSSDGFGAAFDVTGVHRVAGRTTASRRSKRASDPPRWTSDAADRAGGARPRSARRASGALRRRTIAADFVLEERASRARPAARAAARARAVFAAAAGRRRRWPRPRRHGQRLQFAGLAARRRRASAGGAARGRRLRAAERDAPARARRRAAGGGGRRRRRRAAIAPASTTAADMAPCWTPPGWRAALRRRCGRRRRAPPEAASASRVAEPASEAAARSPPQPRRRHAAAAARRAAAARSMRAAGLQNSWRCDTAARRWTPRGPTPRRGATLRAAAGYTTRDQLDEGRDERGGAPPGASGAGCHRGGRGRLDDDVRERVGRLRAATRLPTRATIATAR